MKTIRRALALLVFLAGAGMAPSLLAAPLSLPDLGSGGATRAVTAQEKLKKEAVCTKCHDESDNAPVLTLYQTKHGVRGDARSPTCQNCHGESASHVKGSTVKGEEKRQGTHQR